MDVGRQQSVSIGEELPAPRRKKSAADVACVIVFLFCVGLWVAYGSFVLEVLSGIYGMTRQTFYLANGGEGLFVIATLIVVVSLPLLFVAVGLSLFASRLPLWFRILSVVPALVGLIIGVGIVPAVLLLGK